MRKTITAFFALLSMAAYAQKDAGAVTRPAKNFHSIEITDGIDLYLSQGNEETVSISGSHDDRDKVHVEVINGILRIGYRERGWAIHLNARAPKAYVTVKNLDAVSASGGSDVYADRGINTRQFSMALSGGSDFKGKINAEVMKLTSSGGSDIYISGKADELRISASGGSDVHAYDLFSGNCMVDATGGSDVKITVARSLVANTSGGGDIYYHGNPSVTTRKSGGGSVKKAG